MAWVMSQETTLPTEGKPLYSYSVPSGDGGHSVSSSWLDQCVRLDDPSIYFYCI